MKDNILRKGFNHKVLDATYKAQKKYGFEIGSGEHATWNNEADAFKHAYMSWYLSYADGDFISKYLGDMHENETPNAPLGERNMDLWNNEIGREIAYDMKQRFGEGAMFLGEDRIEKYAVEKIIEKMNNGELITHPDDPRKYENMELERLKEKYRIYTGEEYKNFDEKMKAMVWDSYFSNIIANDWKTPSKNTLDERVKSGELIYVDNYVRANGTKVNGYYRRTPYNKSKSQN